mmetsp:Transcript_9960/g.18867  ORF Transcript_9960/g.18867 Transcript_9960/m.18867 type:complete len:469 (-) Transcript_9960:77-1483(-)
MGYANPVGRDRGASMGESIRLKMERNRLLLGDSTRFRRRASTWSLSRSPWQYRGLLSMVFLLGWALMMLISTFREIKFSLDIQQKMTFHDISELNATIGHGPIFMVGDGATVMEARPPADTFIGYGGAAVRAYQGLPEGILDDNLTEPISLRYEYGTFDTSPELKAAIEARTIRQPVPALIGKEITYHASVPRVTIVLMTHKGAAAPRLGNLVKLLNAYSEMKVVARVIVVLNDMEIPAQLRNVTEKTLFVKFPKNSMNNRFLVHDKVPTKAAMIVDDDVLLNEPLLIGMMRQFKRDPFRLYGLDTRYTYNLKYRVFGFVRSEQYKPGSLVIGKTMLFHKLFMKEYSRHTALLNWIQPPSPHFCEDVAMTALITNVTGKGPVVVERSDECVRENLVDDGGLSVTGQFSSWINLRNRCVVWLARYFKNPFVISTERYTCRGGESASQMHVFSEVQYKDYMLEKFGFHVS